MKKFLNACMELFWPILICVGLLFSCTMKEQERVDRRNDNIEDMIQEAEDRGYERGFDEGYGLAEMEARGELEQYKWEIQGELEKYKSDSFYISEFELEEKLNNAYQAGYEACLDEYGIE